MFWAMIGLSMILSIIGLIERVAGLSHVDTDGIWMRVVLFALLVAEIKRQWPESGPDA